MRALLLSGVVMFPLLAHAQSVPTLTPRVTLAGPNGMNAAFATKADAKNGVLVSPSESGGTYTSPNESSGTYTAGTFSGGSHTSETYSGGTMTATDTSGANAITTQGTLADTLAAHLRRPGIYPDDFYQTADGMDDAPSIQRALGALSANGQLGGRLLFKARIYRINSPVNQTNQAWWSCAPGHMTTGGAWGDATGRYGGTWFQIGSAFQGVAGSPITVSTGTALGSGIENCAFFEIQPPSTNNAPDSTYTWSPYQFPFVLSLNNVNGDFSIKNTLWRNITAGVVADNMGRLDIDTLWGDFYNAGIEIHHSYDVDRITNIHEWGFGGEPYDVLYYKNTSLAFIKLYRVDTPFLDRIFVINASRGIDLETDSDGTDATGGTLAGGIPTKVTIGSLECDGTHFCVYNNASGSTMKIANLGTQGADNTHATFTTWTDSAAIYNAKFAMQEIGNIHAQALGGPVIYNPDGASCGWASVGSILLDNSKLAVNASGYIADGVTCDTSGSVHHVVQLGTPPERFYSAGGNGMPETYMPTTSEAQLYWAAPTTHP